MLSIKYNLLNMNFLYLMINQGSYNLFVQLTKNKKTRQKKIHKITPCFLKKDDYDYFKVKNKNFVNLIDSSSCDDILNDALFYQKV